MNWAVIFEHALGESQVYIGLFCGHTVLFFRNVYMALLVMYRVLLGMYWALEAFMHWRGFHALGESQVYIGLFCGHTVLFCRKIYMALLVIYRSLLGIYWALEAFLHRASRRYT